MPAWESVDSELFAKRSTIARCVVALPTWWAIRSSSARNHARLSLSIPASLHRVEATESVAFTMELPPAVIRNALSTRTVPATGRVLAKSAETLV